jgi:plastocyanin
VIRRALTSVIAAIALVAVAAPVSGAFPASRKPAPKPKIVTVNDDYYAPVGLTIRKGASVSWKWSNYNGHTHNVVLSKAPKSVRRGQFKSSSGAIGIKFVRRFTVPGYYKFVCTLHRAEMQMTLTVKKP